MTKAEIDGLIKIMIAYKKKGQFRAFWSNFNESVNLMASKEVVIESMWSPAVALLVGAGRSTSGTRPRPRASAAGAATDGISSHVASDPAKLQACYDYLNWMYNGCLGAHDHAPGVLHRERRDAAQLDHGRRQGRPPAPVQGRRVRLLVQRQAGRHGPARASPARSATSRRARCATAARSPSASAHYSSWNSYFTNSAYQIKRWNDFLSA